MNNKYSVTHACLPKNTNDTHNIIKDDTLHSFKKFCILSENVISHE